jgi:hypothetical protein
MGVTHEARIRSWRCAGEDMPEFCVREISLSRKIKSWEGRNLCSRLVELLDTVPDSDRNSQENAR